MAIGVEKKADRLSADLKLEIDGWLQRFPDDQRQSAILGTLHEVQGAEGYLSREMMDAVADYIGMPEIAVYEIASFYTMFNLEPVGRNEIAVCTNISCMLRGSDEIVKYLEEKLGIKTGESTADGKFFLKIEEECLAGCKGAPMMQLNCVYHENLTPARIDQILDEVK